VTAACDAAPVPTIGFLHTADVHVPTFRALRAELVPDWPDRHEVAPELLAEARARGVTPELVATLDDRLRALAEAGADLIVCTCSTIGGLAEQRSPGVPVLRADRPMAEAAVAAGTRIAVLAAVESTVEPTLALLRDAGPHLTPVVRLCLTAWPSFESGDLPGYAARIAAAAREAAPAADVIVLAQASMAPAADLLTDLPIPVLTSPRTAVARAVAELSGRA
jgi:Asp/Glu/Hydantoin racemase